MLIYGRGSKSIAAQINQPVEVAEEIISNFYKTYPVVKEWMDNSIAQAKKEGYVTTLLGRRRHLPNMQLSEYSIKDLLSENNETVLFEEVDISDGSREKLIKEYLDKLKSCKSNFKKKSIIEQALKDSIEITDNYKKISAATRQTVNSIIQGSAADLSKKAMIDIYNSPKLRELGFRTLYVVHDEISGECPIENAEEVAKVLKETMIDSASKICDVPMKVDCYVVKHWYLDELSNVVRKKYNKLIESGLSEEYAFKQVDEENPEIDINTLRDMCNDTIDLKTAKLAR